MNLVLQLQGWKLPPPASWSFRAKSKFDDSLHACDMSAILGAEIAQSCCVHSWIARHSRRFCTQSAFRASGVVWRRTSRFGRTFVFAARKFEGIVYRLRRSQLNALLLRSTACSRRVRLKRIARCRRRWCSCKSARVKRSERHEPWQIVEYDLSERLQESGCWRQFLV